MDSFFISVVVEVVDVVIVRARLGKRWNKKWNEVFGRGHRRWRQRNQNFPWLFSRTLQNQRTDIKTFTQNDQMTFQQNDTTWCDASG